MSSDREDPTVSSGPVDADLPFDSEEADGGPPSTAPADVPTTDAQGRPLENPSG